MEKKDKKEDSAVVALNLVQGPNPVVLTSPKTEPMLPPQVWEQVFKYLSNHDLKAVMNTCPEWCTLLQAKKGEIYFPKVLLCMGNKLSRESTLACRLVNKECDLMVRIAYPEIIHAIFVHEMIDMSRIHEFLRNFDDYDDFFEGVLRDIQERFRVKMKMVAEIFRR
ncbi:unnamed protein product [Orchesella dallaii]|uniref:F-box domain-containing protein n=1 Tax=Orchesella dallaii TaxID=48710 RepID=A0ABP1PIH0_9HEXA